MLGRMGAGPGRARWGVLAAAFTTMVLVQGATFTFPVFLIPLTRDFGGLRGMAAAAFSLHNLVVGLVATAVDPLMGRFGERRVFAAAAVILGAGLALSGTADSPLGLVFWFSVVGGVGAGMLGSVAQTVMLSRWFPTARGTVVGLALSGMGIGMFLFAPLSAYLIERFGWRAAFVALGACTALLLLPTNAFTPGSPPEPGGGATAQPARTGAARLPEILRTARFWCFATAFFFTPVSNFMVTTHQVAHMVEAGIEPRWAAAAFGVMGLLSAVGRASFGALSDRLGRVPAALSSYVATALGTLALLLLGAGLAGLAALRVRRLLRAHPRGAGADHRGARRRPLPGADLRHGAGGDHAGQPAGLGGRAVAGRSHLRPDGQLPDRLRRLDRGHRGGRLRAGGRRPRRAPR